MIANFLPYPPLSGGRLRIASLLDWLVDSGHDVTFLFLPRHRFEREELEQLRKRCKEVCIVELRPMARRLQQNVGLWGRRFLSTFRAGRYYLRNRDFFKREGAPPLSSSVDTVYSDLILKKVSRIIQKMTEKPQVVFCEYLTTSRLLELPEFSGPLKILDTLDAVHTRMKMIERGLDPWLVCTPEEEAGSLRRADVVLAIQDEEAQVFRKLVPNLEVITIGQPFGVRPALQKSCPPPRCLLVGSIHAANIEGLQWFQKKVWPFVQREINSAELLIAGDMGRYAFHGDLVRILGVVENLDEVYGQVSVVAVPILSGSGLKIKLVEALSKGKAVVATQHAALGVRDRNVFLSTDDPLLFARHIVTLLKDPDLRRSFERKALTYAKEHLQREQVYSPLKTLLQKYVESPDLPPAFLQQ